MSDVHVLLVSAQAAPNLLPTKANDTLFKLSKVCRRVGGLGTRAMLVSYRRLGDAERRLAQALGITTVCGAEIANLDQRLRTWVSP